MAFPVIEAKTSIALTGSGNKTVNLPSGIVAGELLVVVFGRYGSGSSTGSISGWTKKIQRYQSSHAIAVFEKVATGSEGSTVSLNIGSNYSYGGAMAFRISGAAGIHSTYATAGSTENAPDLNVGSSDDHLWFTFGMASAYGYFNNTPNSNNGYGPRWTLEGNVIGRLMVGSRTKASNFVQPSYWSVGWGGQSNLLCTFAVEPVQNTAPTQPTWVTGDQVAEVTSSLTIDWDFDDPDLPSDSMSAYEIRRSDDSESSWEYFTGSAWQASSDATTKQSGTSSTITFASGWGTTTPTDYRYQVRTFDAAGAGPSPWSASLTITPAEAASGSGSVSHASSTSATGRKDASGSGSTTHTSSTSASGTAAMVASGSGSTSHASSVTASGSKTILGVDSTASASSTSSAGSKATGGSGTATRASTVVASGSRAAGGVASVSASSSTIALGAKATGGTGQATSASAVTTAGGKGASGGGSTLSTSLVAAFGAKGAFGGGAATHVTGTTCSGEQRALGVGVIVHVHTTAASGSSQRNGGGVITVVSTTSVLGGRLTTRLDYTPRLVNSWETSNPLLTFDVERPR